MRLRELLSGLTEDYINPHQMTPGAVPSFAGPRAPDRPGTPAPLTPAMPGSSPPVRSSDATTPTTSPPTQTAQNDAINPHFVPAGGVPNFAGGRAPNTPGTPAPLTPTMPTQMPPGRLG